MFNLKNVLVFSYTFLLKLVSYLIILQFLVGLSTGGSGGPAHPGMLKSNASGIVKKTKSELGRGTEGGVFGLE